MLWWMFCRFQACWEFDKTVRILQSLKDITFDKDNVYRN